MSSRTPVSCWASTLGATSPQSPSRTWRPPSTSTRMATSTSTSSWRPSGSWTPRGSRWGDPRSPRQHTYQTETTNYERGHVVVPTEMDMKYYHTSCSRSNNACVNNAADGDQHTHKYDNAGIGISVKNDLQTNWWFLLVCGYARCLQTVVCWFDMCQDIWGPHQLKAMLEESLWFHLVTLRKKTEIVCVHSIQQSGDVYC